MTSNNETPGEEGFIAEAGGPPGLFGIFEDDGKTGYLYLYQPEGGAITSHLRIYTRNPDLAVSADDVNVEWSRDMTKVGVKIWGKMRGIINVATKEEGRVLLENRDSPGIGDHTWLDGFSDPA